MNNFLTNPKGGGASRGPGDIFQQRTQQKAGNDPELDKNTIPGGGLMPNAETPPQRAGEATTKPPFRLNGG